MRAIKPDWSNCQLPTDKDNSLPPWGVPSKTPHGCLRPWTELSPLYTVAFSCTYMPMMKFNL